MQKFYIINLLFIALLTVSSSCKTSSTSTVSPFVKDINGDSLSEKSTSDIVPEYYTNDYLRYEDYIYKSNISTVLLYRDGWELSYPVITFDTDEKLHLEFDDLDADVKDYKYTFLHCSANWTPSDISKNEYINGFTEGVINNYKFSFNTIQRYTHYELLFPETNIMEPYISGNYLLIVYYGDEENLAFTRRFMIVQAKVSIDAVIKRATVIEYKNYKQEIDFTVNKTGYNIPNIYENLKINIIQNGRWDNAVINIKPRLVKGDILDYNYEDINVFNGGNEYRHFDIKSLRYYSDRINRITYENGKNHVYLLPDLPRTFKVYESLSDINGRRLIKTEDAINSSIEADYVFVHFFLSYNEEFKNGNLYIFGELTDRQFKKEAIATYDYTLNGYTATLYLKQGYYNYHYVFLEDGKHSGDETVIEGNHYETENDYTILAYCREPGTLYDKLIGIKQINTLE